MGEAGFESHLHLPHVQIVRFHGVSELHHDQPARRRTAQPRHLSHDRDRQLERVGLRDELRRIHPGFRYGDVLKLEIRVPEGTVLSPRPPAAVAGGNVETSMRVTDVLYGALGRLAAGQGTMNNLSFGSDDFAY